MLRCDPEVARGVGDLRIARVEIHHVSRTGNGFSESCSLSPSNYSGSRPMRDEFQYKRFIPRARLDDGLWIGAFFFFGVEH